MSEAKRCKDWCGGLCRQMAFGRCCNALFTDGRHWCSPECWDNRRRMHEGEARDPSDDVKLCCPEAKPVTNAAGQPRYWTCAIHPRVAYAPEPLRHAADFRGEGVTRTWGTLCGAPIQTSLVAGTGAVNCPACRLKAAPAPAVEGEPPAEERDLRKVFEAPAGTYETDIGGGWKPFDPVRESWAPAALRQARFRLALPAPVLSRVERMVAERFPGTDPASETEREVVAGRYAEAIRAVCEWLRDCYRQHGEESRACPDTFAAQIAREFLGKGR